MIGEFEYIVYILPGLAQMAVVNHAYQNSSTSLFMARSNRAIENMLVAPVSYLEIVFSFLIGCMLRGLTVGFATLIVSAFFVDFPMPNLGWLFISWALTATLFGSIGLLAGLISESWDHIALFGNFILTPLIYLGGVFYSITMLPPIWQKVSYFNPVFYAVDSTRYAILGVSDIPWYTSFAVMAGMTSVLIVVSVVLFKRGYKLVS